MASSNCAPSKCSHFYRKTGRRDCRKERHFHIRRPSPSSTNVKIESAMFKVPHTFTKKKKFKYPLQEFATIPLETVKINPHGFSTIYVSPVRFEQKSTRKFSSEISYTVIFILHSLLCCIMAVRNVWTTHAKKWLPRGKWISMANRIHLPGSRGRG